MNDSVSSSFYLVKPKELLPLSFFLLLICGFVWQFQLEKEIHLPTLIPIILGGFFIHHFLPLRFRLAFLFCLNLLAVFLLFEPLIGALSLAISLGIFGILSLPLGFRIKALILLAIAMGLLAIKTFAKSWENLQEAIPYVGALFMFRTFLFLHESRFEKEKVPFWKQINYFFLLPNWIMLIFPIVDYKTFNRNYYSRPAGEIYQKGLRWMALGAFHLLLYRLLYFYLMPSPDGLKDIFDLFQYFIIGYGLTLRLSGLFHFAVGVMCLFGFDLPPAFTNYFLSNGFSDLWRRINIYWKDFMMKIFYFPLYFRFKKRGALRAVVFSILIVFLLNWLLHAYQWQWVTGSFLLTFPDFIFWAIFGVLVTANAIYQQQKQKQKKARHAWSIQSAAIRSLQVMGVFSLVAVMYSLWNFPTLREWLSLFTVIDLPSPEQLLLLLTMVLAVFSSGILLQYLHHIFQKKQFPYAQKPFFYSLHALIGCLLLVSLRPVQQQIESFSSVDISPILLPQLNEQDRELQLRGYYETLVSGNQFTSKVWNLESQEPEGWEFPSQPLFMRNDDLLGQDLIPGATAQFKGATFTVNSMGLRDREYSLKKADDVLRIAVIGVSNDMGTGVNDQETYENILEDSLAAWGKLGKVEVINFALRGTDLIRRIQVLQHKVLPFQPDVVFLSSYPEIEKRTFSELPKYFSYKGIPYMDSLKEKMAFNADEPAAIFLQKLEPYESELINWSNQTFLRICRENNISLVQCLFPRPGIPLDRINLYEKQWFGMVEGTGAANLSITHILEDYPANKVSIAPWDGHYNAFAHQLIGEKLFRYLSQDKKLLQLLQTKTK